MGSTGLINATVKHAAERNPITSSSTRWKPQAKPASAMADNKGEGDG
jgi:hypothetical protein